MEKTEKDKEIERKIITVGLLDERLKILEQQASLLESYAIEQQMLKENLEEIKKAKEGQEILVPLGKDIFIEGNTRNTKSVLMNVGAKVIVRKSVDEAKMIVEKNIERFLAAKEQVEQEIEKIREEIKKLEAEISKLQEEK